MKKSIVISMVKGNALPQTQKLHSVFYFKEDTENFRLSTIAEMHFVELEKVNREKAAQDMEPLERLAAYFLYAGDKTKEAYIEDILTYGGEAVTMAEKLFEELTADEIAYVMREQQDKSEHSIATLREAEARRKAAFEKELADAREAEVRRKAAFEKELADAREAEARRKAAFEKELADMRAAVEQEMADRRETFEKEKAAFEKEMADRRETFEKEKAAFEREMKDRMASLEDKYLTLLAEMKRNETTEKV